MSKNNYNISSEQLEKISKKYGNLIYSIAYRIGGDQVANSFERKTGKTFDDFFDTFEFDKYIKSSLWNRKNNTGKKITQKKNINSHLSLDENLLGDESMYESADVSSLGFDVSFDEEGKELLELIMNDYSVIKPSGELNLSRVSRELGIKKNELKNRMLRIKHVLRDYYDEAE